MELITYRKTLDVHKSGSQFMLQGFQTADRMSRVVEISLMASGDAIDFPLERIVAMMYVTTPNATEPSINQCTIKDNKVVYDILPIVEEGITTMQLKLIETSPSGARRVLASPAFTVEVSKSNVDDDGEELKATFSAIEDFIAKADAAYGSRLEKVELDSECIFRAYYADGAFYETDILRKLFLNGNVELSKSYAMGGTGVRVNEDTDNSKYYSNVSRSEALNAKAIMEGSKEILEEVRLHGVYTAFSVDFTTGEVEYVSPSFDFKVNKETGELDAEGQSYTFEEEIFRVVNDWLTDNNVVLTDLRSMIGTIEENTTKIGKLQEDFDMLEKRVTPIELGGTGATSKEEAIVNLGIDKYQKPWNLDGNIGKINCVDASISTGYSYAINQVKTAEIAIPMINSGNIRLKYVFKRSKSSSGTASSISTNHTFAKCFLNDELVNELWEQRDSGGTDEIVLDLNVKKGDIITITASIACIMESASTGNCWASLSDISLYANIETPYKYYSLAGIENITATDILNALTGGAD